MEHAVRTVQDGKCRNQYWLGVAAGSEILPRRTIRRWSIHHPHGRLTAEQKRQVLGLAYTGSSRALDGQRFLDLVGESDGGELAHELLQEAVETRSSDDLEYAIILLFEFGVRPDDMQLLGLAARADWHHSHSDVVTLLQELPPAESVPVLAEVARQPSPTLDDIDADALRTNAIWAIFKLNGAEADRALAELSTSLGGDAGALSARLLHRLRTE